MILLVLLLQFAAIAAGAFVIWRRLGAMERQITLLREAIERAQGQPLQRAPAPERGAIQDGGASARARATEAWRRRAANESMAAAFARTPLAKVPSSTLRTALLALAALAPSAALLLSAPLSAAVIVGVFIGAAMMALGLAPGWRRAAWAGVLTACAWGCLSFTMHAGPAAQWIYAAALITAGAAGLAHAHLTRPAAPGAAMALAMSAAAIALGSHAGMVSAAGGAYAAIVALAAIVGALSLRLEAVFLAAFGAALIGLYVLSGQNEAAIWFTPATTFAGALFLAIAYVRVPALGPHGLAIAGVSALAANLAASALHASGHGLADARAAAGALATLSMLLAGVIVLSASRRGRGLGGLRVTLWALTAGAYAAAAQALFLIAPPPAAATGFAVMALGLIVIDRYWPQSIWRVFAAASAALAALFAWGSGLMLLAEARAWPPAALIGFGFAAPAALLAAAARLAHKGAAPGTGGMLAGAAIAAAVIGANLMVRTLMTGAAPLLAPMGLAEAGAHASVWLASALLIGAGAKTGTRTASSTAAGALVLLALGACAAIGVLRFTDFWALRPREVIDGLADDALGLMAPALLLGAHWVFWRARGSNLRTRATLGLGALLAAAYLTIQVIDGRQAGADWITALVGGLSFSLAILINFAPGVTGDSAAPTLNRQKQFHRNRARQKRRHVR